MPRYGEGGRRVGVAMPRNVVMVAKCGHALRHLSHNLPDIRRLSRATSSSRLTADSVEKNWVSRNVLHVQQLALWYPLYTMRRELREVVFDVHFYFIFEAHV